MIEDLGQAVLVLFKSNEKNKSSEITKKKKQNRIDLLEIHTLTHTHIFPKPFTDNKIIIQLPHSYTFS